MEGPATGRIADVVVLGAGMSGLVGTSVLLSQGAGSVAVLDEYHTVGGNHLDVAVEDYTFDVGSFIFQDDSPLLRHFPELLPLYVPIEPSWARLNPQRMITAYPFSVKDDVLRAGPLEILRIVASALVARVDRRPMRNARDFARHWIGLRFLERSGLESYMARFCGCPIEQIDLTFANSRMLWLKEQTQVRTRARGLWTKLRRTRHSGPSNTQLARPRGGFGTLYAPAVAKLEAAGASFDLDQKLIAVGRVGDRFEVRTADGVITTPRLVSTIPLGRIAALCDVSLETLPTVTLVSLFYSFSGERGFEESILYNFSHDARWKRLTVYSDFYGQVAGRHYFAVEVVSDPAGTSPAEAAAEFRAHTTANGLFTGDLRLEGSHVLEEAYPIYTGGSAERSARAVADLRAFGVESFGRQGGFEYQPTARTSTEVAEQALHPPARVSRL